MPGRIEDANLESRDSGSGAYAPSRNDGGHISTFSRHDAPELFKQTTLKSEEGAGKTGCALHPRSRVQCASKNAHTSIQVQRKHSGLPCAMVLRLIRALLGDHAWLPPSPARRESVFATLAPASERQDHTTSPYVAASFVSRKKMRLTLPRPSHPVPNVRDDRDTPLLWAGTRETVSLIWVKREAEYFCAKGWTGFRVQRNFCPSGKSVSLRAMRRGPFSPSFRGAPTGPREARPDDRLRGRGRNPFHY
jgi:hypothetical protein